MTYRPAIRSLLAPTLLAAVAVVVVACGPPRPAADAIARVGDTEVTYAELARYVEAETESPAAALEGAVLSRLLDQHLTELLLVEVAEERGVVAPGAEGRKALEALLESAPAGEPARTETLVRYEERRGELTLPERVRLRQVLTHSRELAEAARREILEGADFGDVARRYSEDPSAPYGGVQGELAREDLPEAFAGVIFALEPGEVSPVVEADYGYHVFQVTARLPGRVVPFEEAEPRLAERIREERVRAWLEDLVEEARSRYTVRVYEERLPFEYQGAYSTSDG